MGPVNPEIKYSESVEVSLGPSRLASRILLAASGATLGILLATPMSWWARVALAVAVLAHALHAHRRIALRVARRSVHQLRLDSSGDIAVSDGEGRTREGQVREGCFVAPWLTIVRWRPQGMRFDRTEVILPDAIAGEDFRRLRVLLRWGGGRSITRPAGRRTPC